MQLVALMDSRLKTSGMDLQIISFQVSLSFSGFRQSFSKLLLCVSAKQC
jgi:hypothetical protein